MTLAQDLLHPSAQQEARQHKLHRLVKNPNSYFMDVKCPSCHAINPVFSHANTVVHCSRCPHILATPQGGKVRLSEGSAYRRKN